jgi:hypothetical protein
MSYLGASRRQPMGEPGGYSLISAIANATVSTCAERLTRGRRRLRASMPADIAGATLRSWPDESTLGRLAGRFHESRPTTARPKVRTFSGTLKCFSARRSIRPSIVRTRRRRTRGGQRPRMLSFVLRSRFLGGLPTNTNSDVRALHSSGLSRRRMASVVTVDRCWCNFHRRSPLRHAQRRDSSTWCERATRGLSCASHGIPRGSLLVHML